MKKDGGHELSFKDLAEKLRYEFYYDDKLKIQLRGVNCPDMKLGIRFRLKIKIHMIIHRLKQFFKRDELG